MNRKALLKIEEIRKKAEREIEKFICKKSGENIILDLFVFDVKKENKISKDKKLIHYKDQEENFHSIKIKDSFKGSTCILI